MKIFDLKEITVGIDHDKPQKLFYKNNKFKTRVIDLNPGDKIPQCVMDSDLIFYVIEGKVEIIVNDDKNKLSSGQCLITKPANLSMNSKQGAKILGVQIR